MSFIDKMIAASGPAWRRYERHPWFEALEQGRLSLDQFIEFQVEDAPFIPYLHKALAIGLSKAPVGGEWSRAATVLLHDVFVANELKAKAGLLASLGVQNCRFDAWALSPRREGYVNHIMRTSHEGPVGDIAAALLPCTFFTKVVGERFRGVDIKGPEAFRRWAAIYADKQMFGMLDVHIKAAREEAERSGEARERITRIFVRSLQHQVAVFDDALGQPVAWPEVGLTDLNSRFLRPVTSAVG